MKLDNTLIVTLTDFARHFSFAEFWENRRQFVRDMNPERVYYWKEELVDAYTAVAEWINKGDAATDADRQTGLKALSILVGKDQGAQAALVAGDVCDFSADIIKVATGKTVELPPYNNVKGKALSLVMHKIEAHGKQDTEAEVSIGHGRVLRLKAGDFAYATAVKNGGFVEFLPNTVCSDNYELTLVSQAGEFLSTLFVHNLHTMQQEQIGDVVSCAVAADGYMYVGGDGMLVMMSNRMLCLKGIVSHSAPVLYVKSHDADVAVLYADGMLKSTRCVEGRKNVVSAGFDEDGKLHIL